MSGIGIHIDQCIMYTKYSNRQEMLAETWQSFGIYAAIIIHITDTVTHLYYGRIISLREGQGHL